jgi:alkanesulfonate monooxygenase SsuD/methylene tetrahydromethanopterin reductase-like flavin-dependent oxidoreductase (luciferase family)
MGLLQHGSVHCTKRFEEPYRIIYRALTQELVDYEGEFWNISRVSIWPKPIQDPFPPFWMPAGSLESIRFAAENRLVACQTLQPTSVLKQCFDEYRRIANEDFGWKPPFSEFTGLRFMHLDQDHRKALEDGSAMFSYLMLSIGRPVYNPAPLPGFNSDESYKHRRANADDVFSSSAARHALKSSEDQAARFRDAGLMLSGHPETVAEWLVEDAKEAGYGNLIVTFRVGNGTHQQALKSQELFAKYVMPVLRKINIDDDAEASTVGLAGTGELSSERSSGNLPFYQDYNYTLSPDAIETIGILRNDENGSLTVGWGMQIAKIADDGSPTQIIIPGPTTEHKGCAIRLNLVTSDGTPLTDDARVVLKAESPDGTDSQIMFDGRYRQFGETSEQTVAAQMRGVARNDYSIELSVTLPSSAAEPDFEHEESVFEIKCFKHLVTLSA